ncbi:MAG: class I SAM-dependent methyltransferase [Proteobacteria bacterium]|nr:class I SAM-dependent methyltransferase [Pseudomonadota bacterium]
MRRAALVISFASALVATAAVAATAIPAYVARAVADKARADDAGRDPRRHIAELVAFTGVKPGDKVADLLPGNGYFTKVFSKVVGPKGHVYAIWPREYLVEAQSDFAATQAMGKTRDFANVTALPQAAAAFSAPEKLDVVFTSQNYHDYPDKFMGSVDPMVLNRAVYKALKPGGVFVIVDHRGKPGTGMTQTETLHRIDPDIVKAQLKKAGFVYEGESTVLRNPKDPLTIKVFDESIRGRTDQFVLKFRKPRAKR